MADLNNLLDEVDEALQDDDNDGDASLAASDQQQQQEEQEPQPQEWDDDDREDVHVPDESEELARNKFNDDDDDESQDSVHDDGMLFDTNGNSGEAGGNDIHLYSRLKRLWQHEVACPELLPMRRGDDEEDQDIFEEIAQELENREETHAQLLEGNDDIDTLLASILKVDMDRTKFMLADLMRTRLMKIQDYPIHMKELTDRMTDHEVKFLEEYYKLYEKHLEETVLKHIPLAYQSLKDEEMVDKPDLDEYVFVKVKEMCEISSGDEDNPQTQQHEPGDTVITRWSAVRDLFMVEKKVQLIL